MVECVHKVCCGKMVEWIRMPSGMVSGVSRGMHVLDGVVIIAGMCRFGVEFGVCHCNKWGLYDAALPE